MRVVCAEPAAQDRDLVMVRMHQKTLLPLVILSSYWVPRRPYDADIFLARQQLTQTPATLL